MICESDAVVLQTRRYGDSSKIAVLFSKEFGKMSVLAKGAYSNKSKFSSGLEPLSYVHICFYNKPSSDLHLLKSVELVVPFHDISRNYDSLLCGLVSAELVSVTQSEHFVNTDLFEYLVAMLSEMNARTDFCFSYCVRFMYQLADNLGYYIDLNELGTLSDVQMWGKIKIVLDGAESMEYSINVNDFIEIADYMTKFLGKHLGYRLVLRTMGLVE
ncbi:MAG: DNA repair protein RecO [Ignavibacteria bacterium]|jgi:DNA repair protein RecO (recombination protein O)|nr:DNA repair protein RecO [Ignavibacteria bacterium]